MKAILVCVMVVVCAVSVIADQECRCGKAQECRCPKPNEYPNPGYGLTRGFANVMFGWLEIPRGFTYENSRIPLVGVVSGPIKGAFLTTWREIAGVIDIVSMGLSQKGAYFILPDYVWDAPWIHRAQYKVTDPDQTMTYNKPKRMDAAKGCGPQCKGTCKHPQPQQQKPCELAPPSQPAPAGKQIRKIQRIKMAPLSDTGNEGTLIQEQRETEPFHIDNDEDVYTDVVRNIDEQVLVIEGRASMVR